MSFEVLKQRCCRNSMAGVTTSCSIQPFKQPISLSAFQSKLSHLHLDLPNSSISRGCRITCRYGGGGGGGGYSRQGDSRRPKPPADEDPALDISSIRYYHHFRTSVTLRLPQKSTIFLVNVSFRVKLKIMLNDYPLLAKKI